jgi:hypothetical protein
MLQHTKQCFTELRNVDCAVKYKTKPNVGLYVCSLFTQPVSSSIERRSFKRGLIKNEDECGRQQEEENS